MKKLAVKRSFNGWVKCRREAPKTLAGLHLPEGAARTGRSQWYLMQDVPSLGLKEGAHVMPSPEAWFFKVNHEDERCDKFLVKEEHIIAEVEVESESNLTI